MLRDDWQPRRHDDPRMDPTDYACELAEYDEWLEQRDQGSIEARQAAAWLTAVAGPEHGPEVDS